MTSGVKSFEAKFSAKCDDVRNPFSLACNTVNGLGWGASSEKKARPLGLQHPAFVDATSAAGHEESQPLS